MGLGYKRTLSTGDIPVFQGTGKDIQLAQGGFYLDRTGLADGVIIPKGTPFSFDEAARTAKPMSTSKLVDAAGATDVVYHIAKGSNFKNGDYLALVPNGKAYAITAIDTANANYDAVTVGTTLGAVAAQGALVFASSVTGAANAAFPFTSQNGGLLYRDAVVKDGESVSIVIRGTVYARRVPYSAGLEAALPKIIYSQSR